MGGRKEVIINKPTLLDYWEGCTGCGKASVIVSIESISGDYPQCYDCYEQFKKTGFIQAEYKFKKWEEEMK